MWRCRHSHWDKGQGQAGQGWHQCPQANLFDLEEVQTEVREGFPDLCPAWVF